MNAMMLSAARGLLLLRGGARTSSSLLSSSSFSSAGPRALSSAADAGTRDRIAGLLTQDRVVVFMKGVPSQPMCGFSNAVVQILRMHGVEGYTSFNVLDDEGLRQGIKEYTNWPTIPQVFFNGEFVGGCDILLQMHQNGDLVEELKKIGIQSALLDEGEAKK
ncbi:glutaredoxin-related protein 5, mitochondrial [Lampetra fluviatilis]